MDVRAASAGDVPERKLVQRICTRSTRRACPAAMASPAYRVPGACQPSGKRSRRYRRSGTATTFAFLLDPFERMDAGGLDIYITSPFSGWIGHLNILTAGWCGRSSLVNCPSETYRPSNLDTKERQRGHDGEARELEQNGFAHAAGYLHHLTVLAHRLTLASSARSLL